MRKSAELSSAPVEREAESGGDQDAFQRRAEPYRREIQLHCYRMLGSLQDAEDLAQETFLRAWRGYGDFEGRASFRGWLYRIATNACLNALASRSSRRRVLPEMYAPPTSEMPVGSRPTEIPWLEPYPDTLLEGIEDTTLGPDARYELHESVQLAFIATIQLLPPRQRAVLLLRDVLGWSAAETAGLLDTSVASANSALQRARTTLTRQFPTGEPASLPTPDDEQQELLARYVRAWENADVDGLVALLRDDAIFSMPPWPHWYRGLDSIRAFMNWVWRPRTGQAGGPANTYRLIPTAANGQPAFVSYRCVPPETACHAYAIHVLTIRDGAIAAITSFIHPPRITAFGSPELLSNLPGSAGTPSRGADRGDDR